MLTTGTPSVDTVMAVFTAVEQRDDDALARVCRPDVEFCWPPSLPYGGSVRGLVPRGEGWAAYWDRLQPTADLRRLQPRVIAAAGQEVVVLWRQHGLTPAGESLDSEVLGLYRVREGKLARGQMFHFDPASVCAFLARASRAVPVRAMPTGEPFRPRTHRMSCPPPVILVVVAYDSGSRGNPALRGRTAALAAAIAGGARLVEQTHVTEMHLGEQKPDWDALDAADSIVFGCPTYMGSASARMKAFMEESLRPQFLERRWQDKLAAGFTNSAGMSGDKLCTLQQLAGFAAQHGMIWISLGQLPGWQSSNGTAADLNRLASFLGLMAQSNSDQGPDQAPPESDRRTGELFGRRIALITRRWAATLDRAKPASLTAGTPASANGLPQRTVAQTRSSRKTALKSTPGACPP